MKKIIILYVLGLACKSEPPHAVLTYEVGCLSETSSTRAQFIIDCAKAANPHSDEEGEDLVAQCEETAENLYCGKIYSAYIPDQDYSRVPCSVAKDPLRKKACELAP